MSTLPVVLFCPNCLDACEGERLTAETLSTCPNCGALLLLHAQPVPHLLLVCRYCHEVFEGAFGQIGPGKLLRCPKCGAQPGGPKSGNGTHG